MRAVKTLVLTLAIAYFGFTAAGQRPARKLELPHPFYWATPDPLRGDWQGEGGYVAQVIRAEDRILWANDSLPKQDEAGKYQANIFRQFDLPNDKPVVVLQGTLSDNAVAISGDGWEGSIRNGRFTAHKGDQAFDLQHVTRTPPTLGAKPRAGALVLFDGKNMDGWAKKQDKDWLKEDGPTNSGVYIQGRYEANINEMYCRLDCREWQTMDIDFQAPRFNAAGKRTAAPRATLLFNGTRLYNDRELGRVTLNAARVGEAPTGPIQLQEHGMPVQFRNIWVVEAKR